MHAQVDYPQFCFLHQLMELDGTYLIQSFIFHFLDFYHPLRMYKSKPDSDSCESSAKTAFRGRKRWFVVVNFSQ